MKITIYQDTYCPWCYIGKKHLETALSEWDGEVDIEYKSFFLNPTIPKEGMDAKEYISHLYDPEVFDMMQERLVKLGREAGIEFAHRGLGSVVPNTELSHRLAKLYPEKKSYLIQRYYEVFFEEGKNIGDIEVLLELAQEAGIDPEEAKLRLEGDEKRDEVWQDYHQARRFGVQGVPFFVFNDEVAIQGAQKPEILLQTMRRVAARTGINLEIVDSNKK